MSQIMSSSRAEFCQLFLLMALTARVLKDEYCDEIRFTARTLNVVKMPVMDNGKGRVNTYMSLRDNGCVHNTKCKLQFCKFY